MGIQIQLDKGISRSSPFARFGRWFMDVLFISNSKNKQLDFKKYSQLIDAFNTSPSIEKCSQVRELLANSESAIRSYASESLAHYYYYTKNKKEFLELFGHSTPDVRLGALNALSKLENIPIEYDCLSRLFTDATDSVKSKAWSILAERTIKQLRNGNDEASIFLSKLLSHKIR